MEPEKNPDFDAREFMRKLDGASGPDAIDAAFAELAGKLSREDYRQAVTAVEEQFLTPLREDIRKNGVEHARQQLKQDIARKNDSGETVRDAQNLAQVFLNLSRVKGRSASAPVKAFVRAAAKLTDAQYNSADCATAPLLAVISATAKQPESGYRRNPFRPQKPRR
jgi:hypothetical protein